MFDSIAEKFQNVWRTIRGQHRISEDNIHEALRDIRKALLEADVSYTVVKTFMDDVKQKALGTEVVQSVSAGQMITKIIYDEMHSLLAKGANELSTTGDFQKILMVGLQGCGKTTTCAKLALWFKSKGLTTLLVGADTQRPAAREQLRVLSQQVGADYFTLDSVKDPKQIVKEALNHARQSGQYRSPH